MRNDLSLLTDRCETEVCRELMFPTSLRHSRWSLIVDREVLLMFVCSDYKSDGLKALLWVTAAKCSQAGGGGWLLSVSGKYGSLCRFLTGEVDSLSWFPEPGW